MKKAEEYCNKCNKYGHNRSRCPDSRRSGQGQGQGQRRSQGQGQHRDSMSGYNTPPVLGMMPMGMMPMGMPMGMMPSMGMMPMQQYPQFYPGMGMGPGMYEQDFALESHEAVPIELDINFWSRLGVRNLLQTIETV